MINKFLYHKVSLFLKEKYLTPGKFNPIFILLDSV